MDSVGSGRVATKWIFRGDGSARRRRRARRYLVEVAEWLVAQRAPAKDAENAVRCAVDLLLEVDASARAKREGSRAGGSRRGGQSRADGSESGSQASGGTRGHSRAGGRPSTVASGSQSKRSGATRRGSGASASSRQSGSESGGAASIAAPARLGAAHLELLLRGLAMLAQLAPTLADRRRWLLLGSHYATELVNRGVDAANWLAAKETPSTDSASKTPKADNPKKGAKGVDKEASAGSAESDAGTVRFAKIEGVADWATWDASEDLIDHMSRVSRGKGAHAKDVLSAKACPKAPLTAHHFTALADGLQDLGFTAQALAPAACLQLLGYLAAPNVETDDAKPSSSKAEEPVKGSDDKKKGKKEAAPVSSIKPITGGPTPALAVLGGVRRARLLLELGATDAALKQLRALGGLGLTPAGEAAAPDATDVERLLEQRARRQRGASTEDAPDSKPSDEWKVSRLETRHIWCAIASELVALEQPAAASTYLASARRHNDAFGDFRGAGRCAEVAAAIAAARGAYADASGLVLAAQAAMVGDARSWTRTTLQYAKYELAAGRRGKAKGALQDLGDQLRKLARVPKKAPPPRTPGDCFATAAVDAGQEPAVDFAICWASVELLSARLEAAEALESLGSSGAASTAVPPGWRAARTRAARVRDRLEELSGDDGLAPHPLAVDAAGLVARLDFDGARLDADLRGDVVTVEALKPAVLTMEAALDAARRLYAASWPPRDEQGRGEKGPDARALSIAPPAARRAGALAIAVARARAQLSVMAGENRSAAVAAAIVHAGGGSAVAAWLAETEPPDTGAHSDQLEVPHAERALVAAASAEHLATTSAPGALPAARATLGAAFALLATRLGAFDGAWDAKVARLQAPAPEALEEGAEPEPLPPAVCVPLAKEPMLPCFREAPAAAQKVSGLLGAELEDPTSSGDAECGAEEVVQLDLADEAMVERINAARLAVEGAAEPPSETTEKSPNAEAARKHALAGLASAVKGGMKRGRFDDVGLAAATLAEMFGIARPLDAACAILLYQSCAARRYLLGVYRKATARRKISRQASLARVLARTGGVWGCGGDAGDGDDCGFGTSAADDALGGEGGLALGESRADAALPSPGSLCDLGRACAPTPSLGGGALMAGAPPSLSLARPHEFPAAAAARRGLASSSAAWRRSDLNARPGIHGALRACSPQALGAPPLYVLALQLAPAGDYVYAALCRAGDYAPPPDPAGGGVADDPLAPARAAVARHALTADAKNELLALNASAKKWRLAASRYLLRYADDAGADGDFKPEAAPAPAPVLLAELPDDEDENDPLNAPRAEKPVVSDPRAAPPDRLEEDFDTLARRRRLISSSFEMLSCAAWSGRGPRKIHVAAAAESRAGTTRDASALARLTAADDP